ncbi:VanW family protein [Paenibacillus sp. GM2]|uniref:VanW family protein n=1 Tax=Paenibacillus sp. GM2 TaxID=1622070 RepID=UPI00083800E6|nr:VanW family protein [Paenibacillus sp. GM2]
MDRKQFFYFVVPLLVLGFTALSLLFSLQHYAYRDTIPPGVDVAGIPVGGMSAHEAIQVLDRKLAELELEKVTYSFRGMAGSEVLSWENSGVTFDIPDFRAKLTALNNGSLWNRIQIRSRFPKQWRLQARYDLQPLKLQWGPEWEKAHLGVPVNAARTIGADDSIRYTAGKSVYRIDWPVFMTLIQAALPAALPLDEGNDGAVKVEPRKELTDAAGQDAAATAHSQQSSQLPTHPVTISVPLVKLQPSVTLDNLKSQGITRKIAEFSTDLTTSGAGRLHNVEAAARSIDGMLLSPGGIFDYAKAIESAEQEYGFQEAPVIFGGKLVPGVGGGICQVSSTLYNAALRAGLEIVERRNHTLPVSYVPKGQDATFAQGYINFRFKNTTGKYLLIRAKSSNGRLVIKLFGTLAENVTYRIQSRTTRTIMPTNKYIKNPSLPSGSQEIMLEGKPGYVVETFRLKQVDGITVSRTLLSRDTYPAQPAVIAVHDGTERSGGAPSQILEDGVEGPRFP